MMENELAGKQLTIEELTGELEERRATCGPEVMQRVSSPPVALVCCACGWKCMCALYTRGFAVAT